MRKMVFLILVLVMTMGIGVMCASAANDTTIPTDTSYKNDIIVAANTNALLDQYLKAYKNVIPQELLPVNVPITEWTGKQFFILALSKDNEEQGYTDLVFAKSGKRVPHTYAGRRIVVDKVEPIAQSTHDYEVFFTDVQTGEKYIGLSMRESIPSIGYVEDLEKVKKFFPGKTVYARLTSLLGVENSIFHPTPSRVAVNFGQPMKVVDVWEGMAYEKPFYLVVEVNGQRAAVPFAYGLTNQPINTWNQFPVWMDSFFVVNPLSFSHWSQNTLNKINNGEVELGMDIVQVYYSWGKPQKVENAVDENGNNVKKATYDKQILTFAAGKLVNIETQEDM